MFSLSNLVSASENNILPGQERSEEQPSGGGEIRTRPVQLSATNYYIEKRRIDKNSFNFDDNTGLVGAVSHYCI